MTIISFVKSLPENLVYAPIYKKDALMKSGRKATGKNPLEESWERDFDKHDVELAIEKILTYKLLDFIQVLEEKVL